MAAPHDVPTAAQLVEAVREWIERDLMASDRRRTKFHARVAANALAMVEREFELGDAQAAAHAPASNSWACPTTPSWPRRSATRRLDDRPTRCVRCCSNRSIDKLAVANPSTCAITCSRPRSGEGGRRRLGEGDGLAGGELAAGGVDVGAAILADGRVGALRLEEVAERVDRFSGVPRVGYPGVGLSGIRLTWACGYSRRQIAGQLGGVGVAVVDAVDHRPLEADPAVLDGEVVAARLDQVVDRVALVDRHELVAEAVVGGVQRHGEVDRQRALGERPDAGDQADRGDRDVPGRQSEVAVEALDALPDGVEVGHRLAHPHEHDVADPAPGVLGPTRRHRTTCSTISPTVRWRVKPAWPGGAEPARHRAPGLAADAHRRPVAVEHQHRLDPAAAVELPQELDGVAAVADRLGDRRRARAAGRRRGGRAATSAGW